MSDVHHKKMGTNLLIKYNTASNPHTKIVRHQKRTTLMEKDIYCHISSFCMVAGEVGKKIFLHLENETFYRPQYVLYFLSDLLTVDFCALKIFPPSIFTETKSLS